GRRFEGVRDLQQIELPAVACDALEPDRHTIPGETARDRQGIFSEDEVLVYFWPKGGPHPFGEHEVLANVWGLAHEDNLPCLRIWVREPDFRTVVLHTPPRQ